MNNKTLFIILGVVIVAGIATWYFGGGNLSMSEGDDPAMMMAQRSQTGSASANAATRADSGSAEESAPEAHPPTADAGVSAEPADDAAMADAGETAAEEPAAEAAAEPVEEPAADATMADEAAAEEAPAEEGEAVSGDEEAAAEDEAAATEETGDEDLMAEEELPEDPIERFKQMDPRDIIEAKYKDLEGRLTETWNEDNPEQYLPQTGRVDPLTRVNSAVPDDLKPPRSGETDENQIQIYLGTQAASQAVTAVSYGLFCHNVIQIGLEKRATFSFPPVAGDRTFTIAEGSGFSMNVGGVNVTIRVTSIGTDAVNVMISGAVPGADGDVTKTQQYIPRAFYH